jgi:dienelactone hydrolase
LRGPRRALASLTLLIPAIAVTLIVALHGSSKEKRSKGGPGFPPRAVVGAPGSRRRPAAGHAVAHRSFAVGLFTVRLVDTSRLVQLAAGRSERRLLLTYVRYPALGPPGASDRPHAPSARRDGPFPLVIFGHGFAVTPGIYERLLRAWARAGYVVAAPVFPLENADAPGGPNEADLINQPADMSFVIAQLLAESRSASSPLSGLVDPTRIAVSGQSDGGDTALAVAYNPSYRDPRVGAAVILSGAELPGSGTYVFSHGEPPLLAIQGTADTVNPPSLTREFFQPAQRPKYLLTLLGAEHLPPYTNQQPELSIVERVSTAFLDAYLKRRSSALRRLANDVKGSGTATLVADP